MAVFSSNSSSKEDSPKTSGISVLASGAKIVGTVISDGVIKIEGTVEGTVRSNGEVFVGQSGLIDGDVRAREVVVGGRVRGSISAEVRVEMQPGSAVSGDVATPKLAIREGGQINGKIRMSHHANAMVGSDGPIMLDPERVKVATPHGPPTQRPHKKNRAAV